MLNRNFIRFGGLLLLSVQLSLYAFAQQPALKGTFKIAGDVSNYKRHAEKILITVLKPNGGRLFDSVKVVGNKFEFIYKLEEPLVMLLSVRTSRTDQNAQGVRSDEPFDYMSVYAIPSSNLLKLKNGALLGATLEGNAAEVTKTYNNLYGDYAAVTQRGNGIINNRQIKDRAQMTIIRDSLLNVADETVLKPYILANPKSIVSIRALLDYASRPYWRPRKNIFPEMIESMLLALPETYKALPGMVILSESLNTAKKTLSGKTAMDFAALDTAGKVVRLSDFKGKTVFLDFWASWCVPCRKENPNVKKLYEKYKEKGLVVLSVSLDNADKRSAWMKAIHDDGIQEFVHVSELKGFTSQSALLYDVKAIPTNFIIDQQGKFVARNIYGDELAKLLAEVFATESK